MVMRLISIEPHWRELRFNTSLPMVGFARYKNAAGYMAVIAEVEAITQAEIGERTRMDKVTVSRAAIALVDRAATLAEDIAGMRVLQAFTRERAATSQFRQVADAYRVRLSRLVPLMDWCDHST